MRFSKGEKYNSTKKMVGYVLYEKYKLCLTYSGNITILKDSAPACRAGDSAIKMGKIVVNVLLLFFIFLKS